MLTSRGWWFLILILALLSVGIVAQLSPPRSPAVESRSDLARPVQPGTLWTYHFYGARSTIYLGTTLGFWLALEWIVFLVRIRSLKGRLQIVREVRDERGPVDTLWAGRSFHVQLEVRLARGVPIPFAEVSDRLPFGVELRQGDTVYDGPLAPGAATVLEYQIRCPASGRVRFEGVRLQTADLQGFFYYTTFLPAVAVYRVLPPLTEVRARTTRVKRQNLLPPPGQHRHRRPGSGSELLDLRDYMPGDPPKTIAWKVSARRDRLITKEFESEVPVRCTLFVDISNSVRLGPQGQNALTGLVQIAATVAQASAGSRDLTGLCLFDDRGSEYIAPARGPRHLVQLLNVLADAAGLSPTTGAAEVRTLIPLAYAFADEVYPELMRPQLNRVPLWLPWLWPQRAYAVRRPGWRDVLFGWLPALAPLVWLAGLGVVILTGLGLSQLLQKWRSPVSGLLLLGAVAVGLTFLFTRLPRILLFPERRRLLAWRKRLSALLSVRHGLAPGGLAMLLEDDERFSVHVQRFLADHHVPFPLPLYDAQGRYQFAAPGKIEILADALTRAVGRAHDNELLVLLADLLELADACQPLLRAVKVALARHHRVLVICPWPPGIPAPGDAVPSVDGSGSVDQPAPGTATNGAATRELRSALMQSTTRRFHRAFHQLQRTFGRIGVPVICAQSGDPPRIILERLDLLRVLGKSR